MPPPAEMLAMTSASNYLGANWHYRVYLCDIYPEAVRDVRRCTALSSSSDLCLELPDKQRG